MSFGKSLLEWIYNKFMTSDDQIKDKKIQYEINREAAKTSALSLGKFDKSCRWRNVNLLIKNK